MLYMLYHVEVSGKVLIRPISCC